MAYKVTASFLIEVDEDHEQLGSAAYTEFMGEVFKYMTSDMQYEIEGVTKAELLSWKDGVHVGPDTDG